MNHSSDVAIVVDSAASLPQEVIDHPRMQIAPMRLSIDGKTYLDREEIAPDEFYRLLKQAKEMPTTSAPSPAGFVEAIRRAENTCGAVLCITVGARFSASHDAATLAAEEIKSSNSDMQISVLDSESAAGGQGLVAMEAWRAAVDGATLGQVISTATKVVRSVGLLAYVDTFYYLWKGGRVPMIARVGASLLKIKPIFQLRDGEIKTIARPRTRRKAVRRLFELMAEHVGDHKVKATVMHADALDSAQELAKRVESEFDCEDLYVSEFTPVMGAHIGPGLVGIAFWATDSS